MPSFSGTCFLPGSPELSASARQPPLDRLFTSAGERRYIRRAPVLPITPSQQDPVILSEKSQDLDRPVAHAVAIHHLGDVLIRLEIQRNHIIELCFPQYQPVMVVHLMSRDAEQPRTKWSLACKRAYVLERGQEYVLHQILCLCRVREQAMRHVRKDGIGVAFDQFGCRFAILVANRSGEAQICQGARVLLGLVCAFLGSVGLQ